MKKKNNNLLIKNLLFYIINKFLISTSKFIIEKSYNTPKNLILKKKTLSKTSIPFIFKFLTKINFLLNINPKMPEISFINNVKNNKLKISLLTFNKSFIYGFDKNIILLIKHNNLLFKNSYIFNCFFNTLELILFLFNLNLIKFNLLKFNI